jgi:para-aminobenzoate synthetase
MSDPIDEFEAAAATSDRMFWLDGGGSRPWSGRRSIIGVLGPDDTSLSYDAAAGTVTRYDGTGARVVGGDVFEVLGDELAREAGDPDVHWVGYFGYASRPDFAARPAEVVPDAVWMRVRRPRIIEHEPTAPKEISVEPTAAAIPDEYAAAFATVQGELRAGNSYEVNLTYREEVTCLVQPVAAYRRLRSLNPAPYGGYLQHRGVHLLSSSPERYATIDRHRTLETKPIKGTTPRSHDSAEDARLADLLRSDPRFRAENLMIVDLLRNDLAQVCEPGTVQVPELMSVESYQSVHQLVSTIRGSLRDDVSTIAALRALFPAGSMTGAPKRRTMEIIDRVESSPRGIYAGAFGWICADGRADLGVVIRSLVATPEVQGYRYRLGTGGAVTVRSEVASEYAETRWKAERMRSALDGPTG